MPFQIEYPEIEDGTKPRHRFMSSYEQVLFLGQIVILFHFFTLSISEQKEFLG
jgi:hypothetical protein